MTGERMHPADLELLADLVAERLALMLAGVDAAGEPAVLLTAGEAAQRLSVSAEWVRDHRDELGVVKLGDGRRPRLRFPAERVAEALTARSAPVGSLDGDPPDPMGDPEPRRSPRADKGVDVLPVRQLRPVITDVSSRSHTKRPGGASTPPGHATRIGPSPRTQRSSAAPAAGASSSRNRKERVW